MKRPWIIASILFGSTLYFCSNALLLLLLPLLWYFTEDIRALHARKSTLLLTTFVAAGMLNASFGLASGDHGTELRSLITIPLFLATVYLSRVLDDVEVRRAVCILILLECAVGIAQFFLDLPHPFPGQFDNAFVDYSDLSGFQALYFARVYGLSSNSSVFAEKIFIATLMLPGSVFGKFKIGGRALIFGLVGGGLIATFNRTVIFALLLFGILLLVKNYSHAWKPFFLFLLSCGALVGLFSAQYVLDSIGETLSFGVSAGGLDSRFIIWANALDFIRQHLFWGNHSAQVFFNYFGTDNHAHSSFLQMIAMHGLLIALLLFLFVFSNISKANFPFIVAIVAYSLTQYGVFWAMSLMDCVFYYYLLYADRPFAGHSRASNPPFAIAAHNVTSEI